jgi:uncharacterized membrane protein
MSGTLKRDELDRLAAFYSLSPDHTQRMLDLAGARPSRAAGIDFVARCLRYGGILSLASALVFFVAANWSHFAVFGRFALVEAVLVGCVAVALARPPPAFAGRGALFLAFIATGALLALFGQTYQTGADVYELFLGWGLLGLPLAFVARWGVASAAWVLVLNVALLLYCGWQPAGGLLWALFDRPHLGLPHMLLAAAAVNLALWLGFEKWQPAAVPAWVRRLLVFFAMLFVTWVGVRTSMRSFESFDNFGTHQSTTLVFFGCLIGLGIPVAWSLRERRDIFPLAMVSTSALVIVTSLIPHMFDGMQEGLLLLVALWLIGASTAGGKLLAYLQRRWRAERA